MKRRNSLQVYEVIILLHVIALIAAIRYILRFHLTYFGFGIVRTFVIAVCIYLVIVIAAKALIHLHRRKKAHMYGYLRVMLTRASLLNLARIIAGGVLMVYGYAWLKMFVPLLNPDLYDPELYNIDNVVHFGINPNRFLIALFSDDILLKILDIEYGLFHRTVLFGFVWFIATPSLIQRFKFAGGFCLLWLVGSWLYLAVPSLGPCYMLPEDYVEIRKKMPVAAVTQDALIKQYGRVRNSRVELKLDRVIPVFGVAAFPSLHVAAQTFIALWARRRNRLLFLVFLILAFLTFIASLISGWHYAIDAYAGVILAWMMVWLFDRRIFVDRLAVPKEQVPQLQP